MTKRLKLRQESRYFFAADFDALAKQWDKCNHVVGGYIKK
jgi:hypothetical protein